MRVMVLSVKDGRPHTWGEELRRGVRGGREWVLVRGDRTGACRWCRAERVVPDTREERDRLQRRSVRPLLKAGMPVLIIRDGVAVGRMGILRIQGERALLMDEHTGRKRWEELEGLILDTPGYRRWYRYRS